MSMKLGKVVVMNLEGSSISVGTDADQDGKESLKLKVSISEAIQESFSRQAPIEGAKIAEIGFQDSKLVLKIDTDKDGEKLLELELDLSEAIDEIQAAIKAKKEANENQG